MFRGFLISFVPLCRLHPRFCIPQTLSSSKVNTVSENANNRKQFRGSPLICNLVKRFSMSDSNKIPMTKDDKIDLINHMDKRFRQSVAVLLLSVAAMVLLIVVL